jgi:hypothetical protein
MGEVEASQQASFTREGLGAFEELLQCVVAFFSLDREQFLLAVLTGLVPQAGDAGSVLRGLDHFKFAEARGCNEPFVFSGRAENVVADGAAGGDFVVGEHAAYHQGVAEEHAAAWFEYPEHLAQDRLAGGNVAQGVIGEDGIEGVAGEDQATRDIALIEVRDGAYMARGGEFNRMTDALGADINADDAAADLLREMHGVGAAATTYVKHRGVSVEAKEAGDLVGFIGGSPTGLTEVFSIGVGAHLPVDILITGAV